MKIPANPSHFVRKAVSYGGRQLLRRYESAEGGKITASLIGADMYELVTHRASRPMTAGGECRNYLYKLFRGMSPL